MAKAIEIRTSPHLKRSLTVDQIMRNVVIALLPICAFAVYQFGLSALLLMLTTTAAAVLRGADAVRCDREPGHTGKQRTP